MSLEERYRLAELAAEERRRAKARRQPLLLIALLNVLILAVAGTAVVDLRRLATPQGAALAWTQAALFGDCTAYARLSLAPGDRRSQEQLCGPLRAGTATNRTQVARIGLRPGGAQVSGRTATVRVRLQRAGQDSVVVLHLLRRGSRWRVVRDAVSCALVACP